MYSMHRNTLPHKSSGYHEVHLMPRSPGSAPHHMQANLDHTNNNDTFDVNRIGSIEYLDKCRSDREREEEVKRQEEERLQEIISFCEKYNEIHNQLPAKASFSDIYAHQKSLTDNNNGPLCNQFPIVASAAAKANSATATILLQQASQPAADRSQETPDISQSSQDSDDSPTITAMLTNGIHKVSTSSDSLSRGRRSESSETVNALMMESALLKGELEQMKKQQFSDTEDDELREFQKIERDIKLIEINKCLEAIEKQINERTSGKHSSPGYLLANHHHQQHEAPLAEAEASDSDDTLNGHETAEELSYDDIIIPPKLTKKSKKASSLPPNEHHSVRQHSLDHRTLKHQRSLTLYVPSGSSSHDENGLVAHVSSLGHDLSAYSDELQITCCTCSGYLWKLCSNSDNKWKKRFFHFDRHYKVFFYYKSLNQFKKVKKPNGGVYFDEIRDVYIDRSRSSKKVVGQETPSSKTGSLLRRKDSNRCAFVVETARRQFVLSTFNWQVMRIWVDVIFTGAESYFD